MIIYEKCPICDTELEAIENNEGFVIDWFCNNCGRGWTLEDLEFEPIQKTIEEWV